MKALALCTAALLGGCAMSNTEKTWQALHAVDVAQTLSIVDDDCYVEANPVVNSLIGDNPSHGDVLLWAVGWSVAHYQISQWLDDKPRWLKTSWDAVTITATGWTVFENHRIGLRPVGSNQPSRKFKNKNC